MIPGAVTKIQANYRGFNVRTNFKKFKAALLIQVAVRKFLVRKTKTKNKKHETKPTTTTKKIFFQLSETSNK
jgi:hypothetical protein